MKYSSELLTTFFLALTLTASAQQPTSPLPAGVASQTQGVPMHGSGGGVSIVLSVLDEAMAHIDEQAMVRLYDENIKHASWQPTAKNSETTFDELGPGKYDLQVNAPGYLIGRKDVEISSVRQPQRMEVKLILHPDPDAVELGTPDASMPDKAKKEAEHGISDLKFGKVKDAQKHLENACNQSPSSAYANFLLGYFYFQQNDFDYAQTYLTKATTLDAHDIQALNLLGRLRIAQRDYAGAKTTLEQAVSADSENATSHALLADAYLNLGDYKNAVAEADFALAKGKRSGSNAQIVRGQALANLGRDDEAIQTLNAYLQAAPDTAAGPQVQQLIAALQERHH
jgi:Flp pilus assembly protein TadD